MIALSLFDGISCGQIALERAGINYKRYYSSEIDQHAIAVTQANYPQTIQLGDVRNWRSWDLDWSSIDLVLAGSPCQGFSWGGRRQGFADSRSVLFFEFIDILHFVRTHNSQVKFLLENVDMKREFVETINKYTGVKPVTINSALISAQNRKRVYWGNFEFGQPENLNIVWGDVAEFELTEYRHSEVAKNLFTTDNFQADRQCVAAMRGRYCVDGKRQDGKMKTAGLTKQYIEFRYDKKSNALSTVQKDNVVVPFALPARILRDEFFYRYLSPVECERLQTIPDNYTATASKTQRCKMLGNAWTVDVIAHILKAIAL